jgi:hypothetical protein
MQFGEKMQFGACRQIQKQRGKLHLFTVNLRQKGYATEQPCYGFAS